MRWLVSIILLNYNWLAYNQACIDALLNQTYDNFEVLFVNNKSDDGSCEQVTSLYPAEILTKKLQIVTPGFNSGFAWGNNIWAHASSPEARFICLLNNDTIVTEDRLEQMIDAFAYDPQLGVVWWMIYDQGYEDQIDKQLFLDYKKWVNNYFFDSVLVDQTEKDKQWPILYTTGVSWCCLMYKKELLNEPFDDVYFAYLEDTALCIKVLLQWYTVWVAKKAIVHHFGSWSFGKRPTLFKTFHGQKNYLLNFILLSQGYYWIAVLPFFILWIVARTLCNHQLIRIRWLLQALRRVSTHTRQIRVTRKNIKKTITPKALYTQLSPLFLTIPFYQHTHPFIKSVITWINSIAKSYFNILKHLGLFS